RLVHAIRRSIEIARAQSCWLYDSDWRIAQIARSCFLWIYCADWKRPEARAETLWRFHSAHRPSDKIPPSIAYWGHYADRGNYKKRDQVVLRLYHPQRRGKYD